MNTNANTNTNVVGTEHERALRAESGAATIVVTILPFQGLRDLSHTWNWVWVSLGAESHFPQFEQFLTATVYVLYIVRAS